MNSIKIQLNKKEIKKILNLLKNKPDNTIIEIDSKTTGIGYSIKVKIKGEEKEVDVSDYNSW